MFTWSSREQINKTEGLSEDGQGVSSRIPHHLLDVGHIHQVNMVNLQLQCLRVNRIDKHLSVHLLLTTTDKWSLRMDTHTARHLRGVAENGDMLLLAGGHHTPCKIEGIVREHHEGLQGHNITTQECLLAILLGAHHPTQVILSLLHLVIYLQRDSLLLDHSTLVKHQSEETTTWN
jgi:hypothetical protein